MQRDYKLFINNEFVDSSTAERFPTFNPYTGEVWASIPQASAADVDAAVQAATTAFNKGWRSTTGLQRAKLINRLADLLEKGAEEMGVLESTDNGKIIRETHKQVLSAARVYRFYAGYADKIFGRVIPLDRSELFDYATAEPLGVVALITPWNSPTSLLAAKLAPALAAGNCVVIKPSEHASATTLEFCKLVVDAGFPAGVINVVTGDERTGKALMSHQFGRVSFTGSTQVGRIIAEAAGRTLSPVTLELGGKSPNMIFADANLDKAVAGAVGGIFSATGQTCVAGSRLLVQRPVYDEVVDRIAARAKKIKLGDPLDHSSDMGTAANEPQFKRILDMIESGNREGARLVTGGGPARGENLAKGLFIQPTVFADVHNEMTIAREEIFGPVLSIIPFEAEDEAVEIANETNYGLAAGIWTRDISRALRVSRAAHAGKVWVNMYRAHAVQVPSGGFKDSGFGREGGEQALSEFYAWKNVMVDLSD